MRFPVSVSASILAAVLLILGGTFKAAAEVRATDDRGRRISLKAPAQRIIALAPHVTELLFAAGAGRRLAGVDHYSDFPPAAAGITEVGDAGHADLERILGLRPDLVVAWKSGNSAGDVAHLERLGIPVFVTEPRKLADIARLLRELGRLAGSQEMAERAAADFERRLAQLARRYQGGRAVPVFYQIWHQPLMTVNGAHMIANVIRLCGGRNVFESLPALTPVVGAESLLGFDPEVIIASVSAPQAEAKVRRFWARFPTLRAVRDSRLVFVHPDLIQRQTPRILEGAEQVCAELEKARRPLFPRLP